MMHSIGSQSYQSPQAVNNPSRTENLNPNYYPTEIFHCDVGNGTNEYFTENRQREQLPTVHCARQVKYAPENVANQQFATGYNTFQTEYVVEHVQDQHPLQYTGQARYVTVQREQLPTTHCTRQVKYEPENVANQQCATGYIPVQTEYVVEQHAFQYPGQAEYVTENEPHQLSPIHFVASSTETPQAHVKNKSQAMTMNQHVVKGPSLEYFKEKVQYEHAVTMANLQAHQEGLAYSGVCNMNVANTETGVNDHDTQRRRKMSGDKYTPANGSVSVSIPCNQSQEVTNEKLAKSPTLALSQNFKSERAYNANADYHHRSDTSVHNDAVNHRSPSPKYSQRDYRKYKSRAESIPGRENEELSFGNDHMLSNDCVYVWNPDDYEVNGVPTPNSDRFCQSEAKGGKEEYEDGHFFRPSSSPQGIGRVKSRASRISSNTPMLRSNTGGYSPLRGSGASTLFTPIAPVCDSHSLVLRRPSPRISLEELDERCHLLGYSHTALFCAVMNRNEDMAAVNTGIMAQLRQGSELIKEGFKEYKQMGTDLKASLEENRKVMENVQEELKSLKHIVKESPKMKSHDVTSINDPSTSKRNIFGARDKARHQKARNSNVEGIFLTPSPSMQNINSDGHEYPLAANHIHPDEKALFSTASSSQQIPLVVLQTNNSSNPHGIPSNLHGHSKLGATNLPQSFGSLLPRQGTDLQTLQLNALQFPGLGQALSRGDPIQAHSQPQIVLSTPLLSDNHIQTSGNALNSLSFSQSPFEANQLLQKKLTSQVQNRETIGGSLNPPPYANQEVYVSSNLQGGQQLENFQDGVNGIEEITTITTVEPIKNVLTHAYLLGTLQGTNSSNDKTFSQSITPQINESSMATFNQKMQDSSVQTEKTYRTCSMATQSKCNTENVSTQTIYKTANKSIQSNKVKTSDVKTQVDLSGNSDKNAQNEDFSFNLKDVKTLFEILVLTAVVSMQNDNSNSRADHTYKNQNDSKQCHSMSNQETNERLESETKPKVPISVMQSVSAKDMFHEDKTSADKSKLHKLCPNVNASSAAYCERNKSCGVVDDPNISDTPGPLESSFDSQKSSKVNKCEKSSANKTPKRLTLIKLSTTRKTVTLQEKADTGRYQSEQTKCEVKKVHNNADIESVEEYCENTSLVTPKSARSTPLQSTLRDSFDTGGNQNLNVLKPANQEQAASHMTESKSAEPYHITTNDKLEIDAFFKLSKSPPVGQETCHQAKSDLIKTDSSQQRRQESHHNEPRHAERVQVTPCVTSDTADKHLYTYTTVKPKGKSQDSYAQMNETMMAGSDTGCFTQFKTIEERNLMQPQTAEQDQSVLLAETKDLEQINEAPRKCLFTKSQVTAKPEDTTSDYTSAKINKQEISDELKPSNTTTRDIKAMTNYQNQKDHTSRDKMKTDACDQTGKDTLKDIILCDTQDDVYTMSATESKADEQLNETRPMAPRAVPKSKFGESEHASTSDCSMKIILNHQLIEHTKTPQDTQQNHQTQHGHTGDSSAFVDQANKCQPVNILPDSANLKSAIGNETMPENQSILASLPAQSKDVMIGQPCTSGVKDTQENKNIGSKSTTQTKRMQSTPPKKQTLPRHEDDQRNICRQNEPQCASAEADEQPNNSTPGDRVTTASLAAQSPCGISLQTSSKESLLERSDKNETTKQTQAIQKGEKLNDNIALENLATECGPPQDTQQNHQTQYEHTEGSSSFVDQANERQPVEILPDSANLKSAIGNETMPENQSILASFPAQSKDDIIGQPCTSGIKNTRENKTIVRKPTKQTKRMQSAPPKNQTLPGHEDGQRNICRQDEPQYASAEADEQPNNSTPGDRVTTASLAAQSPCGISLQTSSKESTLEMTDKNETTKQKQEIQKGEKLKDNIASENHATGYDLVKSVSSCVKLKRDDVNIKNSMPEDHCINVSVVAQSSGDQSTIDITGTGADGKPNKQSEATQKKPPIQQANLDEAEKTTEAEHPTNDCRPIESVHYVANASTSTLANENLNKTTLEDLTLTSVTNPLNDDKVDETNATARDDALKNKTTASKPTNQKIANAPIVAQSNGDQSTVDITTEMGADDEPNKQSEALQNKPRIQRANVEAEKTTGTEHPTNDCQPIHYVSDSSTSTLANENLNKTTLEDFTSVTNPLNDDKLDQTKAIARDDALKSKTTASKPTKQKIADVSIVAPFSGDQSTIDITGTGADGKPNKQSEATQKKPPSHQANLDEAEKTTEAEHSTNDCRSIESVHYVANASTSTLKYENLNETTLEDNTSVTNPLNDDKVDETSATARDDAQENKTTASKPTKQKITGEKERSNYVGDEKNRSRRTKKRTRYRENKKKQQLKALPKHQAQQNNSESRGMF